MNKQRLAALAAFLRTVSDDKFNIINWTNKPAAFGTVNGKLREDYKAEELQHTCGFAACAVGWACAMPEFQAEGLGINGWNWPKFGDKNNWGAVEAFFGLIPKQAQELFSVDGYAPDSATRYAWALVNPVTPDMVADKIEELIE